MRSWSCLWRAAARTAASGSASISSLGAQVPDGVIVPMASNPSCKQPTRDSSSWRQALSAACRSGPCKCPQTDCTSGGMLFTHCRCSPDATKCLRQLSNFPTAAAGICAGRRLNASAWLQHLSETLRSNLQALAGRKPKTSPKTMSLRGSTARLPVQEQGAVC